MPLSSQLSSIASILDQYDTYIIDLWGVMHNGKSVFKSALEVLHLLNKHQKQVIFLSNAPRRLHLASERLTELGIPLNLYQGILTSGELTFEFLKSNSKKLGNRFYHIGPVRDHSLFEGLPFKRVEEVASADWILNSGTNGWDDTLLHYQPLLNQGHEHRLPMVCANPDQVVIFGDSEAICAGLLAKFYENLGGDVTYFGKPYLETYLDLQSRFAIADPKKVLVIGDSLGTDIAGANHARWDSLWILGGIHKKQTTTKKDIDVLLDHYQVVPTYVMACLQ